MVPGLMLCITSLMGCMELSVQLRGDHFTYMPFWQDNILGVGIYDCTQKVHWQFCAKYFKKRYNE